MMYNGDDGPPPTVEEQLAKIKPGETYPSFVRIKEKHEGQDIEMQFSLQSYQVGMYSEVKANGKVIAQSGDHNNKRYVKGLCADINAAIKRGAEVEIGPIRKVKKEAKLGV